MSVSGPFGHAAYELHEADSVSAIDPGALAGHAAQALTAVETTTAAIAQVLRTSRTEQPLYGFFMRLHHHISICAPNSMIWFVGSEKYCAALEELRTIEAKSFSRQRAMPGRFVATIVSRPR